MAARSAEVEDYKTACDMDECRWEYRRAGSSRWEPLSERDHNTLETAHILNESRALIKHFGGGGYHSQTIVDMQRRTFSAGYGSSYEVRRIVLYTPEEIVSRHNKHLVQMFMSNPRAKAFADQLFDEFKNEPDSDDSESEDEAEEELIEEKLKEFLTAIGIDAASIQPAILFWQMNVKGCVWPFVICHHVDVGRCCCSCSETRCALVAGFGINRFLKCGFGVWCRRLVVSWK